MLSQQIQESHTSGATKAPLVWLFNAGYEPNLRTATTHYTPPATVRQFRQDLAPLPIYLATSAEQVLVPSGYPTSVQHPRFITKLPTECHLQPWGWAPELLALKAPLPYTLPEMQQLGSRQLSLRLWHEVYQQHPSSFPYAQAPLMLHSIPHHLPPKQAWVVKEEYSSSGRGVLFYADTSLLPKGHRKAPFFLEPWYPLVENRGYEFYRTAQGHLTYLGGSAFHTEKGRYEGNCLLPRQQIEQAWQAHTTTPSHTHYLQLLTHALQQLPLGHYSGLLGVDTAVMEGTDGKHYLLPPLEVNVRPTMGHIALGLSEMYIQEGQEGLFRITKSHSLLTAHAPLYMHSAPTLKKGQEYALTPILSGTQFVATLTIL